MGKVMEVVLAYIDQMYKSNNFSDSKAYSRQVLEIVDNSDLNPVEKNVLRNAIAVSFASANLWNVDFKL